MGFGIGRVPADVDPVNEALAEVEAERLQPTPPKRADREYLTCRQCGEQGYWGSHPFTTYGHTVKDGRAVCDDCGA